MNNICKRCPSVFAFMIMTIGRVLGARCQSSAVRTHLQRRQVDEGDRAAGVADRQHGPEDDLVGVVARQEAEQPGGVGVQEGQRRGRLAVPQRTHRLPRGAGHHVVDDHLGLHREQQPAVPAQASDLACGTAAVQSGKNGRPQQLGVTWRHTPMQCPVQCGLGSPRCGWQLPLYAWCSCECCAAICQKAVSSSQNAMSLTEPLMLTFGGFMIYTAARAVSAAQKAVQLTRLRHGRLAGV